MPTTDIVGYAFPQAVWFEELGVLAVVAYKDGALYQMSGLFDGKEVAWSDAILIADDAAEGPGAVTRLPVRTGPLVSVVYVARPSGRLTHKIVEAR